MKKIVMLGAAGVLALALGTSTLALAHFGRGTGDYGDGYYHNRSHIDENYDIFCDEGAQFCMDYYDADCDGICDNCHDENMHRGTHHYSGHHHR